MRGVVCGVWLVVRGVLCEVVVVRVAWRVLTTTHMFDKPLMGEKEKRLEERKGNGEDEEQEEKEGEEEENHKKKEEEEQKEEEEEEERPSSGHSAALRMQTIAKKAWA